MALTNTSIRNAKPGDKPKNLFDERGLFLLVQPSGGKLCSDPDIRELVARIQKKRS